MNEVHAQPRAEASRVAEEEQRLAVLHRPGRRLSLAGAVRDAATRGEMHLVFQPVFDLVRSEVVAVEARPRWDSPEFGEVSHAEFMAIAEETGAIVALGAWMLRESCEVLAAVTAEIGRPLELGVKVTAPQLAIPGFARSVRQMLAHAAFRAAELTIETPETALMAPDAASAATLRELEALGVRTVLDDFGTGFSSLAWLRHHPHHGIKIDSGLIRGLPGNVADRAMVAAVIAMARTLGCTVTAQGVDTEMALDALRALGCARAQGRLLAPPVAAGELAALVR
jgi:EAL domain-containing protein (putative c-di-GMP-specific phosphodiesterase class I)